MVKAGRYVMVALVDFTDMSSNRASTGRAMVGDFFMHDD